MNRTRSPADTANSPVPKHTIELDLSDLTVVDEWQKDEPTREGPQPFCECGRVLERESPDSLVGLSVAEWPCCSNGTRWHYCAALKRIIYYFA